MGPEWIIIGAIVALGVGIGVLVAFYRKLSSIERRREHRTNEP